MFVMGQGDGHAGAWTRGRAGVQCGCCGGNVYDGNDTFWTVK